MNINGDKIFLRAIEYSDKDVLLELINDSETEELLGGWSFPVSSHKQEEWIRSLDNNGTTLRCIVVNKVDLQPLGTVILNNIDYKNGTAEIHIKLVSNIRGKGYGIDTLKSILKYSFNELRLHCIYSHINDYNLSSQRLFEKCGFKKEGILIDRIYKNGNFHNVFSYSILSGDLDGDRQ